MSFSTRALVLAGLLGTCVSEQYWWQYTKSDCSNDDVSPQPSCASRSKGNVGKLIDCCSHTAGCGGFNTNGYMKKVDCSSRVAAEDACDLYTVQDKSQAVYWDFVKSDCGYHDVDPQPACGPANKGNVAGLKTCCDQTDGCAGFNTNGVIKNSECLDYVSSETTDLYVKSPSFVPGPPPTPAPVPRVPLWPLPASATNGTMAVTLASDLSFSGAECDTLKLAYARYHAIMFPHAVKAKGDTSQVQVSVADLDESHPQLGTDESYSLTIPLSGPITISAKTVYGAMHALESLAQLVHFSFDTETYSIAHAPWQIDDMPRFPHRGLMVDTSRHFQPLQSLRDIIDSLPTTKMNVLHWHMSDSQSFPMESKTYPKLWQGAFSEDERYTQDDIADIVEYARQRGVRTMVEFDMPGHASAWCAGYPEVCPSVSCTEPLNVANEATFTLIESLLGEVTGGNASTPGHPSGLFPENMVHLGGDEVNTKCWTNTPSIQKWLDDQGFTADEGYAYFVKRAADIVIAQGHRPVQWVEVFDHFGTKLDNRTIVHVWKSKSTLPAVVEAGYQALINNSPGTDSWYLDHLNIDWQNAYMNEPCVDIPDAKQCALVLGGQGEMWGETVDASDIQNTVWPKLAAIGERLWSPRDMLTTAEAAGPRMLKFRCMLNRRGVAAAPSNNEAARSAPPGPGSCFDQ